LSGNVRVKRDAAHAAAEQDNGMAVNVAALERVLPADLGMQDVEPRLDAAGIDAEAHRDFLAEILQDPTVRVEHPGGALWAVRANNHSVRAISEWGTGRMPAAAIAKAAMEQRPIQITDEIDDGERTRRVVNPTEIAAAQEKAQAMQ
jgi:N12 class adenine-specific DNA methylase